MSFIVQEGDSMIGSFSMYEKLSAQRKLAQGEGLSHVICKMSTSSELRGGYLQIFALLPEI